MRNRLLLLVAALAGGVLGCGGDDDGPAPLTGPEATAEFTIPCTAAGMDLSIPVVLTGILETDPTTGATLLSQVSGSLELTEATANIIVAVGGAGATVTLADLVVDLAVVGATPTTITLGMSGLPQTLEFDANGDGVGEANTLQSDVTETSLTLDGSGSLDITLTGATVSMTDVPVIPGGTLDLVVPTVVAGLVTCSLPDPAVPIHFDVL